MKIFIIFALIAVAYADFKVATGEDLHGYRDSCKAELSIPDDVIEQFKKWQFSSDLSACYIHCVFKHMHLYNDDGFEVDNLVAQLSAGQSDDLRPKIEACVDNTEADHCKRAFKGFQCFSKNNLSMIKSSVH